MDWLAYTSLLSLGFFNHFLCLLYLSVNLLDERFFNLVIVAVNLKCSKHATMSMSMVGGYGGVFE